MTRRDPSFAWDNYAPQHRGLIALRLVQARQQRTCTLCKGKAVEARVLVHVCLRSVGAEAIDPKPYVRALGLCKVHTMWNHDQLADVVWPGWRAEYTP
jgi:hypothetical protein